MDREKTKFSYWFEWSDYGESSQGRLPTAVVLPCGQTISLEPWSVQPIAWAQGEGRPLAWVVLARADGKPLVSILEQYGGDDTMRRSGRTWATMEILAPKDSRFLYVYAEEEE